MLGLPPFVTFSGTLFTTGASRSCRPAERMTPPNWRSPPGCAKRRPFPSRTLPACAFRDFQNGEQETGRPIEAQPGKRSGPSATHVLKNANTCARSNRTMGCPPGCYAQFRITAIMRRCQLCGGPHEAARVVLKHRAVRRMQLHIIAASEGRRLVGFMGTGVVAPRPRLACFLARAAEHLQDLLRDLLAGVGPVWFLFRAKQSLGIICR
jgi:hypothetical protein